MNNHVFSLQVAQVQHMLQGWLDDIKSLHNHNKWMVFFNVPKLMHLYRLLTSKFPQADEFCQEVGFVLARTADPMELKQRIEVCKKLKIGLCWKKWVGGGKGKVGGG